MASYTLADGVAAFPFLWDLGVLVSGDPTVGEDFNVGTLTVVPALWFDPEANFDDDVDFEDGKGLDSPRDITPGGGGGVDDPSGHWSIN